ncbi:hypothetical protein C7S15_0923 [Burkholderia cepacia]|nr:hypothetical protein [Burkholderia cepacia]
MVIESHDCTCMVGPPVEEPSGFAGGAAGSTWVSTRKGRDGPC